MYFNTHKSFFVFFFVCVCVCVYKTKARNCLLNCRIILVFNFSGRLFYISVPLYCIANAS